MPLASGLSAQYGWAAETTVGQYATASMRFHEFLDDSLKLTEETIKSQGLAAGRKTVNRYAKGLRQVQGDIDEEVMPAGWGAVPQYLIGGTPATTTPAGGTLSRTHTTNAGALDGKSRTIQIGRPNSAGSVDAFSYVGCKVTDWALTMESGKDGVLSLKQTIDALDQIAPASIPAWVTNTFYPLNAVVSNGGTNYVCIVPHVSAATFGADTANFVSAGAAFLQTASYPAANVLIPWSSVNITLTIGGTAYALSKVSLGGTNNLSAARTKIGSNVRAEQTEGDNFRAYPVSFDVESYLGLSSGAQALITNHTEAAIVATFNGPVIEQGTSGPICYGVQVTLNRVIFEGDNPMIAGPSLVGQTVTAEALYNSSGSDVTFAVTNVDTTP